MKNEPYGYVWTSIKDGMETRFSRMYPNDFYKPTDITPVYKSQQRTWVGLTYEDMIKLEKDLYDVKGEIVLPTTFAMAVEAKLKEKNT